MDLFKKNQPKLLKVEVSEKNVRLRVVLVVLLLAAGLSLLAYWFYSLITKEPGWYTVELTEGKYHQVKRMFGALSNRITELERITFGPLSLDPALGRGDYRELTADEVEALRQAVAG